VPAALRTIDRFSMVWSSAPSIRSVSDMPSVAARSNVSELMTNAAEASACLPDRPPITLRLLASEKSLVIEAWDRSPRDLEPGEAGPDAECGRGLTVVAAISDRWGWERTGYHRKVVWAELALQAGQSPV
jgi:anti-sigma regulatory factor (Ser/Thr protein kinase)